MRSHVFSAVILLIIAGHAIAGDDTPAAGKAARAKRDAAALAKGLVMHEWGAISYAQSLDDARTDTPGEDTSDLPEFAQVWSKLAKQPAPGGAGGAGGGVRVDIVVKKPIVYFYSDKPESLTFTVACPRGMFTQWFPKATKVLPDPSTVDAKRALAEGGAMLSWKDFDVRPGADAALQPVPESAWWWPICRDTDSTPINVDGVWEKFLFYRGKLADAPPVVRVEGGANQEYTLTNTTNEAVAPLLMVNVSGDKATLKYFPTLAAGATANVDLAIGDDAKPAKPFAEQGRQQLAEVLEGVGLFPKEAAGMTRIWRKDWFEHQGVRLIYLNPPGATASLMPVSVSPRPASVVRTLLVSIECLKDSCENVIKEMLRLLGDGEYAQREAAQRQLTQLGKLAEPALREALKTATDEEVKSRITIILKKLDPRSQLEEAEKDKGPNQGGRIKLEIINR